MSHSGSFFQLVSWYSKNIRNGRSLSDVYHAAQSEMHELSVEMEAAGRGEPPGDDGIVGESMDAILSLLDLIHEASPGITPEMLDAIAVRKLNKWKTKYSTEPIYRFEEFSTAARALQMVRRIRQDEHWFLSNEHYFWALKRSLYEQIPASLI